MHLDLLSHQTHTPTHTQSAQFLSLTSPQLSRKLIKQQNFSLSKAKLIEVNGNSRASRNNDQSWFCVSLQLAVNCIRDRIESLVDIRRLLERIRGKRHSSRRDFSQRNSVVVELCYRRGELLVLLLCIVLISNDLIDLKVGRYCSALCCNNSKQQSESAIGRI